MDIFFDPADGRILFTVVAEEPHGLTGPRLTLPDRDLGDLTGWRVIDSALVLADLQPAKDAAIRVVNAAFGALRLTLITDIPGQMAIYQAKEAEARAWLAAPVWTTLDDYPLLSAEIGITAPTAHQLAQLWLNMAALFRTAAAQSERQRLGAIAAIAAAPDEAALDTLLATITRDIAAAAAPTPEGAPT